MICLSERAVRAYKISTIVDPLMWTALQSHSEKGVCMYSDVGDVKQKTI